MARNTPSPDETVEALRARIESLMEENEQARQEAENARAHANALSGRGPVLEYPKRMYHTSGASKVVASRASEAELGDGWHETPAGA